MIEKAFQLIEKGQLIINETEGSLLVVAARNNNHLYCDAIFRQLKKSVERNIDVPMDQCGSWEKYNPNKVTNQALLNMILLFEIGQLKLFLSSTFKNQFEFFQSLNHLI